jgi:hypothetical protein
MQPQGAAEDAPEDPAEDAPEDPAEGAPEDPAEGAPEDLAEDAPEDLADDPAARAIMSGCVLDTSSAHTVTRNPLNAVAWRSHGRCTGE